ncbi:hypothetical protein CICLE_v10013287mg [Citrus x clementina]|uniref:Uncharacterized protein n=1 Tax=Citrus clementina TaxID=85681 RepID=V4SWX5_CITCL|nr:hypothetical protein CICLE_v10013287mg [Citrus x clementina]
MRRKAGKNPRKKSQQFPGFHLEDKVSFWEGSNVRPIKLMLGVNIKGQGPFSNFRDRGSLVILLITVQV